MANYLLMVVEIGVSVEKIPPYLIGNFLTFLDLKSVIKIANISCSALDHLAIRPGPSKPSMFNPELPL